MQTVVDRERLLKLARAANLARKSLDVAPIIPGERGDRLALSFAQQRLWFLEQLGSAGRAYHIPKSLRLRGELHREALGRALDRIVERHEALRTTFHEVDGEPVQVIGDAGGFQLSEHDLGGHPQAEAELRRLMAEESGAPFDLARGPLIRGRLVRMADDDHALLVTMHHIVSDGWSMDVVVRELGALYGAFSRGEADPLPALPVQYADYSAWQRRWVNGEVLQKQVDYWKTTLSGAPELLELPADRPRPAQQDPAGAFAALELDEELTAGLKALGQRHGATLFMTMLAAWSVVLARLSGQDDVVIGTPTANRGRKEIEGLIGFFVNTLALRMDLSGAPTVAELLGRVKAASLGAQHHQDIPFEQVVEVVKPARSMAHTPLFQVMFSWQSTPAGSLALPGLELAAAGAASHSTAKFDLSLALQETGGRITGGVTYAKALYDAATLERYLGYLRAVVAAMVADETQTVDRIPLLADAERWQVVEGWNATDAEYPSSLCVHQLFEAQVERTPHAIAVACDGAEMTYEELNARANRLAHHLRALGVGPDARVAVCSERTPELVAGLLAILKAGGAYVPLDPAYPDERLRHMVEDSAPVVLLAQESLAGRFPGVPVLDLGDAAVWAHQPATNPAPAGLTPDHLAYLIYTSGSTGLPKGVMVRHQGLTHYIDWAKTAYADDQPASFALYSSFAFDLTVTSLYVPLVTGGAVVVYGERGEGDIAVLRVFEDDAVDVVKLTPAHLALLEGRDLSNRRIRKLIVGGEELKAPLARSIVEASAGEMAIFNEYGPTETVVGCMIHRFDPELDRGAAVPIGRPITNTRMYVLDANGEPVPMGVVGELYIGGAGVARGYLNRAELTAERFVEDRFSGVPGARLYRTGDLGRWLRDGTIEFLGRNDFQVKIRGFRIELGEIEARLCEVSEIREAVVLALGAGADTRLVAYYAAGDALEVETLRAHLMENLPDYMVPAAFVHLDTIPLTNNGKVDRKALPAPEGEAFAARAYEAPVGETEEALAAIWAEVLGVERVGRHDHFFHLGGHSLRAVQVISRMRQRLGLEAGLGELFQRPVLAEFARGLQAAAALPAIEPVERGASVELSFAQQRLWFIEQLGSAGRAYHIPARLRLHGELDRDALVRALDRIVERHEALRTTFVEVDGQPVQVIGEARGLALAEHDLAGHDDAEAELRRVVAEESAEAFDLANGPLVRGRLVRMAADDHVLLVTMHHIVSDGWSMGVLTHELGALYGAFTRGEADPLPALPVQYADYAVWQRRRVDGEVLQKQADYWKTTLTGAPELLELPADRARPAVQSFAGAVATLELDEELTAGLKALGQRHGATLNMTLMAAWAAVLGRLSGQDDVVIGAPTANRGRAEIEGLIGFFVNTLALRVDLARSPTVAELLARVKGRVLGAQEHQDIPFEQVVDLVQPARSMAHTPLFQVLFAWQGAARGGLELPGLKLAPVGSASHVTAKFDLTLNLQEQGGRIVGAAEYATSLFDGATIERYLRYLRAALAAMVADETQSVDRLPLLSADERRQVVEEWNATDAEYPGDVPVHALFEAQAERTPHAVAVTHGAESLTYAELNARANRLARHLRESGVGAGEYVVVLMSRSIELVVAELGVLKAGAAYVPIDPTFPAERIAFMAEDSGSRVVLARSGGELPELGLRRIDVDALAEGATENLDVALTSDAAAYVMYTSGSTGTPKGVVISHRSIGRLVFNNGYTEFGPADRVAFAANPAFDATTMEVWGPLLTGGRTVVVEREVLLDPAAFARVLAEQGITALFITTAVFNQYAATIPGALAGLRCLMTGGEAADPSSFARVLAENGRVELVHCYGPTETTTFAITHPVTSVPAGARTVPLGRPISNTRIYILDAQGQPVPVGTPGELYIGGEGVALGYLNRPELTAERFAADPFHGGRMYRTGDVGRWLADGTIEFVGRTDFQVKVRGFRIELGEIEGRLLTHPGVSETIVLAREDVPGDKRLVAYYTGAETEVESLRAHLLEQLPDYMVPAAYVKLDALPLNHNGKVDRKALPAPEADAFATRGYEAPLGATEEALAAIWAEVLGVEQVGRNDHFFHLGGHSLRAVQVVSRVRQALGLEVSLNDLFGRPVLADFARGLTAGAGVEAIVPAAAEERQALSFAQQRLWFLEQLGSAGKAYHVPTRLRLHGALDRDALVRALDRIVERHEALRTVFHTVDGEPVQVVHEARGLALVEHDLTGRDDAEAELRALAVEEAGAAFDLEHGPLIRGRLVRMAADDHVLLVTMHHIVSDGWSMGVLTRELSALYTAFVRGEGDPLPALPVQYPDYAAWQRRRVDGDVLQAQADYWKTTLAGAPELLEIPADHARPLVQSHAGTLAGVELDEELTAGLKALSQRHGTTLYMTLMAGWATVLGRLSGQDDVVIGSPTANRGRSEIEGLIGFFVNTLALRVDLSGAPTVGELLARVKGRVLGAQEHQDIPFEQVVDLVQPARSMAHTPLFQVMFAWQNNARGSLELPGLTVGAVGASSGVTAKFDLALDLQEMGGRIVGGVTYATSLYEAETVERYLGYLRAVLAAMVADDAQATDRLDFLPEAERLQVVEGWNATATAFPDETCIHEMSEAQVERTPDAIAVTFEDTALTYAELNARANQLAHHLRGLGVGPDARVAICVERSLEMMVGLLAILKAGGAYVPMDASYPEDRLRYMLENSAPVVLLSQASLSGLFADMQVPVVDLVADAAAWAAQPVSNPERVGTPESLAYVIYTSGSTGLPKGVMNEHRGVVNRLVWMQDEYGLQAPEAVLQKTPFSFDVSVWEFFWALLAGARVVMARPEGHKDPSYLVETIKSAEITTMHFVPSMLQLFLEHGDVGSCTGLKRVMCSGEALPAALVRRFHERLPGVELHNLYGPTEAAVDVTAWACTPETTSARVPIGRPIANTRIYILDAQGQPVPVGVSGELFIGGVQVARGYLGRPELTGERFLDDPFVPGGRMYRTGDLARWLADGSIEYLGRNDFQVKIRGFRIELGEIEARLEEMAEVREAVVMAREDASGDKRLVAYYVAPDAIEVEVLRARLSEHLPEHMVPAAYVRMDALPLTPNGKADRKALPAPEGDAFAARAYEAPLGETETAVAAIWAEVLGAERVGRHDHFFAMGGHSLLAVRVISRVRQAMGVEAALGDLFQRPVLAEFARGLDAAGRADLPAIERVERGEGMALSFAQQRLWFLEQLGSAGKAYHMPTRLHLRGELDRGALVRALDRIVERHEALRTVFRQVDGEPVQVVTAGSRFRLAEHDLAGREDADAELRRLVAEEADEPFDLEHGPLIRGRLVRLAADEHVLAVTMHHIVSDGWSMGVLTRELGALYAAFLRGESDPLPELPVQYADYAAWQRKWVDGEVLQKQADYWKSALTGAPELLEIPTDHARPAVQRHAGGTAGLELDEELTAGLRALGQKHGTTLFMTLMAGWAATLGRLSGQDDVVIGTPTANRGRSEIEGLIGFFVNTLALRMDLSGSPTVAELLGRVKARATEAQDHQDIPFEQVVDLVQPARSMAHSPLFQAMFTWQSAAQGTLELPGLTLGGVAAAAQASAKFDLSLSLQETGGRVTGGVSYATSLFEQATVERYLGYFRAVLAAMVADDAQAVDRLPLLPADERARVVTAFNATAAEFPRAACIHELFRAHAERTPAAVAVVCGGEELTYAELDARANGLAHHLRGRGIGAGDYVAILMQRSVELVVAELGVLKAGAAYVPIDPTFPAERVAFMVADSGSRVVLGRTGDELPELGVERVDVDALPVSADGLDVVLTSDAPAYVMYTSGSTGAPKGVVVPHRAIARLVVNGGYAEFDASSRVAFASNPAFDATTMEVWAPLLNGGGIVVIPQDVLLEPRRFGDALVRHGVNTLWMTVGLFNQYADELAAEIPLLRYLIVGGDALDPRIISRVLRGHAPRNLVNGYGPTETTTFAITHAIEDVAEGARSIPLGRPISNTRIYILDAQGQPVPVGVAGEIYIGGEGVALGYLNRPELTAERFVPDPFHGGRMYRTGDLGRWLADGTVEFLGRNDFQVKLRGFRIELGEIEAQLATHPALREVVVAVREDAPGDKRLVAYYVGMDKVDAEALRTHLTGRVPAYMVPAAFVAMDKLPLTPNGKVNRKALPAPEGDAFATRGYEAPVGETEQALAEIWAGVLGVERVGRNDHFFELGGHSLRAVQVISRVRQALGLETALGDLFARPVLADFARGLTGGAAVAAIRPAAANERQALSFAQQRLWFLEQLGSTGRAYHIPTRMRLRGELDRDALVRALDRIVERHEALRTTFHTVDGEPVQVIAPEGRFALAEHDLAGHADADAELRRLMAEESAEAFDLVNGPLVRGRLVRIAADDHVLVVTMHHIVSDGWSMGVLSQELGALYTAFLRGEGDPLPALPVQYADYAAWQRRRVDGDVLQQQADYWKTTLTGAPELLEIPTDHARPLVQSHAGALAGVELDEELTAGLKALSRRHGTTLYMTLMAAWATVLGRLSGQDDVVIGSPTANRGRSEIEGLIGFFVNTLALRMDLSGTPTVGELLGRVKARATEAQEHQDIPFEQVVERVRPARSMAHSPLFQVMFTWQNTPQGKMELPGLTLAPVGGGDAAQVTAKFDISLTLQESAGRIVGAADYATSLFEAATIERYLGYFRSVLAGMVADDTQTTDRLPFLAEAERRQVVEGWNATDKAFPDETCIHEMFEAQVERTPQAIAVTFEDTALTYAELNARANQLAHHLRGLGVGPDARVGICVERSLEMMVGLLAILKAGGAYVPMDASYPEDRLRYMLENSAPVVLLSQASLSGLFADMQVPVVDLVADAAAWAAQPETNPERVGTPESLAYVIYTSGSTGLPKGVMNEHRGVVNRLVWMQDEYGLQAPEAVLQKTPFSFDVSVWEFFWALLAGARVVMARPEGHKDPSYLVETIRNAEITTMHFVPSMLQLFLEHAEVGSCTGLKRVMCSGEALPAALVRRFHERLPGVELHNLYGPTEAAVDVTAWACTPETTTARVPIGRPIANTRIYILDAAGQPVPVGVSGELFIGGVQVARGYLGRPELTAERFVEDPFVSGGRLYRTGDLARWLPDGSIEYLGRNDFQVKIRGFRIELGEIEARLEEIAREAVVMAREDGAGGKRLVAYYVAPEAIEVESLRAHLLDRLPDYMVPAAYVRMDALPLTPNGKVDRKALPAPDGDAFATRPYEAPEGELEETLAEIWAELLGLERVGRHDNFFEMGGHSLMVVTLVERMRQRGLHADIRALFTTPTLAALAGAVGGESREVVVPANLIPDPEPNGSDEDTAETVEFFL
jgi:amino acid adenylation domain-containing protein